MRFEDYLPRFEGNLSDEARRILGSNIDMYAHLQAQVLFGKDLYRQGKLKTLQDFYRMFVDFGFSEITAGSDPLSKWVAEEISNEIQGESIIDVGCCNGLFTVFYALNHPDKNFIGLDLSEHALSDAKKRAEKHGAKNTSWVCGDAMTFDKPFHTADTVIAKHSLHQMLPKNADEIVFLDKLSPAVRQGTKIIVMQTSDGHRCSRNYAGYEQCGYKVKKSLYQNRGHNSDEIAVFTKI